MDINEIMPIGSVVLLKDAIKKVMIFGVKQIDKSTDIEYDYIGVVWPEGNMGDGTQFFFNHDAIDKVVFRGFENDERETFIEKLAEYYEKK